MLRWHRQDSLCYWKNSSKKLRYRILLARGNIRRRWLGAGVELHTDGIFRAEGDGEEGLD
jgi:hypothetical protein